MNYIRTIIIFYFIYQRNLFKATINYLLGLVKIFFVSCKNNCFILNQTLLVLPLFVSLVGFDKPFTSFRPDVCLILYYFVYIICVFTLFKVAYLIRNIFYLRYQIVNFSNIARAILDFSLLLHIKL